MSPHMLLCELFSCSPAVGVPVPQECCSQQWVHTVVGRAKKLGKPFSVL